MADLHFFSIGDNLNSTGHYGFVQNEINASKIDDGLMDSGDILNKMGTSIPTPYARLYLFDSAFRQVNTYHSDEELKEVAHEGVYDNEEKIVATAYHHLVSECLDMLEFIFKYGNEKKFGVIEWDVQTECNKIQQFGTSAQKELAEALYDAYNNTVLGSFSKIYLFTWDGVIVGGTSPITLVFTSPNVRRQFNQKGLTGTFKGEEGNILFDQYHATPLHKRSENFRKFIYTYWLAELSKVKEIKNTSLFTYIKNSKASYDKHIVVDKANPSLTDVVPLESTAGIIKTANVNLYCSRNVFNPQTCDYIIKPKVNIYKQEIVNGAPCTVEAPAVLTENGIDGFRYAPRPWNKTGDTIPAKLEKYLSKRELPGTTFKYPYLTVDDFLSEKLIEVSYNIRKDKFYTGSASNVKFLMPLKKEFFKFFTIDDIDKMIKISQDKETENVTVDISVPVSGGTIKLSKIYTENDRVDCYDATHTFDLAIFPSYQVPVTNNQDFNVYNVMLGSTLQDLKIKFYRFLDLSNDEQSQCLNNVKDEKRTNDPSDRFETRHINIPSSFDLIEICVNHDNESFHGLIIPRFKQIPSVTQKFTFCVDFGTTNTQVSYVRRAINSNAVINIAQIKSFDISEEDAQIMLLNDDKGFGFFLKFKTFLQREFVPSIIGQSCDVSYPMRTTSWEINTRVATLKMFENMNIGFNYDKELSVNDSLPGQYKTNIKWAVNDVLARDRMREYFKQLLWMMKSKSALNGGGVDFEVIATYPQSMRVMEASVFKQSWKTAAQQLKTNVEPKFELESVAPYYSFLSELSYGKPYMNLDIGGGTTDILHVRPIPGKNDQTAVFSAIFAANDIWGDGCNDASTPKENGFVTFYEMSPERESLSDAKKLELTSVCQNASSSADIMSYLFSHDNDVDAPTHISQAIQGSVEMMRIPIVHFTSLMYYVAFVLDLAELKIPKAITFTGMGSKYIKLISDDEVALGQVISKIFSFYGQQVNNSELLNANIEIKFAPEPKLVTASGGLIMNSRPKSQRLVPDNCLCHGYDSEEYGHSIYYRDIQDSKSKVIAEFKKFTNIFKYQPVIDAYAKLGHPITSNIDSELVEIAESSFDLMINQNSDPGIKDFPVEDPMFFWPLKDTLYQLGKICAGKAIQRKKDNN